MINVILCVMSCDDVVYEDQCVVVCTVDCGCAFDGLGSDEGNGKVESLILCCFWGGVGDRQTDSWTDRQLDIGVCKVAFATENHHVH